MTIDRFIALMRTREQPLMDSLCRIERATGETVFDPETGLETPGPPDIIDDQVQCQIRRIFQDDHVRHFGDQPVTVSGYVVKARTNAHVVVQDRIVVLECPDPMLIGERMRVRDVPKDEWLIHRVLLCEEAERPGGD